MIDKKNQSTVLYDYQCAFCQKSKTIVEKLDWFKNFSFHPLEDPQIQKKFPKQTQNLCFQKIHVLHKNGSLYSGADGIVKICLGVPLLFFLGLFFSFPLFKEFARWIYSIIAKERYNICPPISPSEEKSRQASPSDT